MLKGWKTIAVAAAVAVLGLLEQLDITSVVPDEYDGLALAVVGLVMAGLRFLTTTSVGKEK